MLKLLFAFLLISAGRTELVLFASKFGIDFDKACPSINLALSKINTIKINCELHDTSKLIGCIKESVKYLIENIFKIQKCLRHKSYYEFSSLLNNFNEEHTCIIFHTIVHLNDHLKSLNSNEVYKEIELKEEIQNYFDDSCSVQSFKIGLKISNFISNALTPVNLIHIVKNWTNFFNNPESNSNNRLGFEENNFKDHKQYSETSLFKDPSTEEKNQGQSSKILEEKFPKKEEEKIKEQNIQILEEKFPKKEEEKIQKQIIQITQENTEEKFQMKEEKKNLSSNSQNKKNDNSIFDNFWEEFYCIINKYPSLDFIKSLFYYKFTSQNIALYECSKFKYDTNAILLRIFWLSFHSKLNLTEDMFRWALGKVSNFENEKDFFQHLNSFGDVVKDGIGEAYKFAENGIKVSGDSLKKIFDSIKDRFT